jgi:hypothetical protein
MGTRADFYVGRGPAAEWLGSIAWDGYPAGIDSTVFQAIDESDYRGLVSAFLRREDGTTPDMGWPWPWDDSGTTDYAYAYDGGAIYGSSFGHEWFVVDLSKINGGEYGDAQTDEEMERIDSERGSIPKVTFPNMKDRANVTLGPRSGVIVFGGE